MSKLTTCVAAMLLAASTAHATIIVNLSASPTDPNAGFNSGFYAPNPVVEHLQAGTYAVSVVGIAGGGEYDSYTVYQPALTNNAYTDSQWSVYEPNGTTLTWSETPRFDTSAAALAFYRALPPLTFTLSGPEDVSFYLDDSGYPYFADDSGGVSLGITQIDIPEPGALGLLGAGLVGLAALGALRSARGGGVPSGQSRDDAAIPPNLNAPRSSP